MPLLSSYVAHTFRIPSADTKVTCVSDEFRYTISWYFLLLSAVLYQDIVLSSFFSQMGCSLCSQTSLHVSQPCKTPGSIIVLAKCLGSMWWYQFSDIPVPRDSSNYYDYNFMVNIVSIFVANKICLFSTFTFYWRTNWIVEFRVPGEYCYILNQYYVIMSLRHTRPPVQHTPIEVFPCV
jgi:hypothetical protein